MCRFFLCSLQMHILFSWSLAVLFIIVLFLLQVRFISSSTLGIAWIQKPTWTNLLLKEPEVYMSKNCWNLAPNLHHMLACFLLGDDILLCFQSITFLLQKKNLMRGYRQPDGQGTGICCTVPVYLRVTTFTTMCHTDTSQNALHF